MRQTSLLRKRRNIQRGALLLLLLTGCVSTRPERTGDVDATSLLNRQVPEINIHAAPLSDVISWVIRQTDNEKEGRSLNAILLEEPRWRGEPLAVSYHASNVTIGAVLIEALRQTGLKQVFTNEALVFGTQATIDSLNNKTSLPGTSSPELARKLEEHLASWTGCGCSIHDTATEISRQTGIPIDTSRAVDAQVFFTRYTPSIRNMRIGNFLWWVAVLTHTELVFDWDKVRFESKSSVVIRDFRCNHLTPTAVISSLHDAWRQTPGAGRPLPLLLVGETNALPYGSGSINVSECNLRTVLRVVETVLSVKYQSYTNGVVFVPLPCYDGRIVCEEIPVDRSVADALRFERSSWSNAQVQTETSLDGFGIRNFTIPGCSASYDQNHGTLLVQNVYSEVQKIKYLLRQVRKGVPLDDIAIDPSVGCAEVYWKCDGVGWIEYRRQNASAPRDANQ